MRAGLRAILATDPQLRVVGEAATGWEALQRCRRLHPAVVLLDIGMPERDGIGVLRETRQVSDVAVVMLTAGTLYAAYRGQAYQFMALLSAAGLVGVWYLQRAAK